MANQPIILREGGSILGNVSIERIHWAEPVRGTVKDGNGNILALATMSYAIGLVFYPPKELILTDEFASTGSNQCSLRRN
jgi:hypothetical protein